MMKNPVGFAAPVVVTLISVVVVSERVRVVVCTVVSADGSEVKRVVVSAELAVSVVDASSLLAVSTIVEVNVSVIDVSTAAEVSLADTVTSVALDVKEDSGRRMTAEVSGLQGLAATKPTAKDRTN